MASDTSSWPLVKFCNVVRNVDTHERNPLANGLERYIGLEHLDPESLHIKRWGLIAEGTSFTRKFTAGHVLFGKRRAYQRKAAVAEFDGLCSGDILVFEPSDNRLLPELLPFIVQSEGFVQHALGTSAGSLSPRTKWRDLAAYEFALPPKDEQRRMAEILWAAEETIEAWQKASLALDQQSIAVREHIVSNPTHPRRTLGDFLIGLVPGRSVIGVNQSANLNELGVLKVSAVGVHGFVEMENKRLINSADFRPEFRVKMNDLLITRANTRELVGRVCIVPKNYDNLMLCDKTIRIDVSEDKVLKPFLLEALRGKEVRSQIEARASGTGGAMKNISQEDIRSLCVPLPDLETQQRITLVLQRVEVARNSIETHLEQTVLFRKTLLNQLLMRSSN